MTEIFSKVKVRGIVLSGNGPLKIQLHKSPFLHARIVSSILCVVQTDYGGQMGFNQTITKCAALMERQEFENEDKLIQDAERLMRNEDHIVAIGFDETLLAIELNVAKRVILCSQVCKFAVQSVGSKGKIKQVQFAKNEIEKLAKSKEMLSDGSESN